MNDDELFLTALAGNNLPQDERLILCGFPGDPNTASQTAWRPRPWKPGSEIVLNERGNGYVAVSSFYRSDDGSFRRRSDCFAAGRAMMIDDVGTRVGLNIMAKAPPASAVVETSFGNFQWWYFLSEPERDPAIFNGLISAFIHGKLLGADPGMAGITRVGRIPGFINGKPKAEGWPVKLHDLNDHRYTTGDLLEAFGLHLVINRRPRLCNAPAGELKERSRHYSLLYKFFATHGMLKQREPDRSGWSSVVCPWIDEHTGRADNGAALCEPSPDNQWWGGFRCHHSHGTSKTIREVSEWVNEMCAEELEQANERAGGPGA